MLCFHFRVYNLACELAKTEPAETLDIEVVLLSALLHDIDDWKYSGRFAFTKGMNNISCPFLNYKNRIRHSSETAGVEAAQQWLEVSIIFFSRQNTS